MVFASAATIKVTFQSSSCSSLSLKEQGRCQHTGAQRQSRAKWTLYFKKLEMCYSSQYFFCPMLMAAGQNILCGRVSRAIQHHKSSDLQERKEDTTMEISLIFSTMYKVTGKSLPPVCVYEEAAHSRINSRYSILRFLSLYFLNNCSKFFFKEPS